MINERKQLRVIASYIILDQQSRNLMENELRLWGEAMPLWVEFQNWCAGKRLDYKEILPWVQFAQEKTKELEEKTEIIN